MERKCDRCKQRITEDDFLCPHCGAIIGQAAPVRPARLPTGKKSKRKWPTAMLAVLAVVLTVSIGAAGWFLKDQLAGRPSDPQPSTTIPATTAPLRVYTAIFGTTNDIGLSGTVAHVYLDGKEVCNAELGADGEATFVLPENDGYTIRLSKLPVHLMLHYGEVDFSFPSGEWWLEMTLEEKPVPFVVKVVDSAGEPVSGVGISFSATGEEQQTQTTDAQGQCTFMSMYTAREHQACVEFVPNIYANVLQTLIYGEGSMEARMVLQTWEEAGHDPQAIHTIRVLDENGQPASGVLLYLQWVNDAPGDSPVYTMVTTNLEGCYSFAWVESGGYYMVWVDWGWYPHESSFQLREDEPELLIQLPKKPQEYTYTVTFHNQFDEPIENVTIILLDDYDGSSVMFTSDQNGEITFTSTESEPTKVRFSICAVPDDYDSNIYTGKDLYFPAGRWTVGVVLQTYDSMIPTTDSQG